MHLPLFALLLLLLLTAPVGAQSTITVDPTLVAVRHTTGVIAEQVTPLTVMTSGGSQTCTLTPLGTIGFFDVEPRTGATPFVAQVVATGAFLPPGDYSGRIRITCSNTFSPREVTVIVGVKERNELYTSVPELRFNLERNFRRVATKSFIVRSSGVGVGVGNQLSDPFPIVDVSAIGPRATPYTVNVRLDNRPPNSSVFLNESGSTNIVMTPTNGNVLNFPIYVGSFPFGVGGPTVDSMQFFHQVGGLPPGGRILELLADRSRVLYKLEVAYDPILGVNPVPAWLETNRVEGFMSEGVYVRPRVNLLPTGTHRARLLIRLPDSPLPSIEIPISVTIGTDLFPIVQTERINFATVPNPTQVQSTTLTKTFTIDNPRGPVQFALKVDTGKQNPWLRAEPMMGTTPATITLTVDPTELLPSSYEGTIEVLGPGMDNVPYKVPVRLNVTDTGLIRSNTEEIKIVHPLGRAGDYRLLVGFTEPPQTIGPNWVATKLVANPADNSEWVRLSSTEGRTPWSLGVTVDPAGLPPGEYLSTVYFRFNDAYDTFFVLPVRLTVTNRRPIVADKPLISFFKEPGAPNPAAQELTLSTLGDAYDLRLSAPQGQNGNWLVLSQTVGATPFKIRVQPNAANTFPPGRYRQNIIATPIGVGEPITIPAEFVIGFRIQTNTESLQFEASTTGPMPGVRTVTLSSAAGAASFQATATTDGGGNWLSVSQPSPGIVIVSASQSGLPSGRYTGRVRVTGTNVEDASIPVTFIVSPGQARTDLGVSNGASFAGGAVSPGTLITLFGDRIGPPQLTGLRVENGLVATSLAQTEVLFDDVSAPMVYASRTQTSALVPFEMAGRTTARLRVIFNGVTYYDQPVQIASAAPGIFTTTQNGSGQAAAINQDGSANGPSQPSPVGGIIAVYLTGLGQTNPASRTGEIVPGGRPQALEVTATVNGIPAPVNYAGAAPGLAAGIGQVNIRIPAGTPSGAIPLVISAGGNRSQANVTIQVQ